MIKKILFIITVLLILTSAGYAEIKTQWRGPNRDGIYPEKNLLKQWPAGGPKLLWAVDGIGDGFSSAAVTSDRIYINGSINETGYVTCLDKDGKQLWKKSYGRAWHKNYPGTRSTITNVDDLLYLTTGTAQLFCLNADSGETVWKVDLGTRFGASIIRWGYTESILVEGDYLFCTPGGLKAAVVKMNRKDGTVLWTCNVNGESSAYCSPVLVKHGSLNLLLTMTQRSIVGINADNGKLLWTYEHITKYDINPNTPLYKDGYVFCSSGYKTGSVKLKLGPDGKSVKKVWRNKELDSQFDSFILLDGYIYGSGHESSGWYCIDWKTGKTGYRSKELKKGNIILAEGMFYIYTEGGKVALVKPDSSKLNIVSSFKIEQGTGQHWAHTVVKDGRLYVRHGDSLLVYSIAK
ncbi:MAG: PQQ-binding-like beta-propeller repeat protein [Desulfobacteraceae bacterium]